MKKFIYLMAMVCTLGFFTACSSDDDDNGISSATRRLKVPGRYRKLVWIQQPTSQQVQ